MMNAYVELARFVPVLSAADVRVIEVAVDDIVPAKVVSKRATDVGTPFDAPTF
jgi:hypothetical protein